MGLELQAWARVPRRKTPHPRFMSCPGAGSPAPLSAPTFRLAGVVRLHEVARAAAEVAALGVVAELRAGAEAQALVDVWGLHTRVRESLAVGASARLVDSPFLPWHPGWPGTVWKPVRQAQ